MRAVTLLYVAALTACAGSLGGGGAGGDDDDAVDGGGDAARPNDVDPCAAGDCWQTALAAPLCGSHPHDEDFSSGEYNVHSYRTIVWSDDPARVTLARGSGDWQPALVVRGVDGVTLFDGSVGLEADGVEVAGSADGDGSEIAVTITSSLTRPVDVVVTSRAVLDSGTEARLPTSATYTLELSGDCGVAPIACAANGHPITEPACGWIHFAARRVVPALSGSRDQRLTAAARVAWWSLKEGVLSLDNPIVYSNCNTASGDKRIGPLETCAPGRAWQVGLSGVQAAYVDTATVEATAADLYADLDMADLYAKAGAEAGLGAGDVERIAGGSSDLRRSWLLRESAIGFQRQAPVVTAECVNDSRSWCYGTGWQASAQFAPDRAAALRAIDDVRGILDQLAP